MNETPDIDTVLRDAFASTSTQPSRPSLVDVRQRVRRRSRRRRVAGVGAIACTSAIAVGLVARNDPGATGTQANATDVPISDASAPVLIVDAAAMWQALDFELASNPAAAGIRIAADADRSRFPTGDVFAAALGEDVHCYADDGTVSGPECTLEHQLIEHLFWQSLADFVGVPLITLTSLNPAVDFAAGPVEGTILVVGPTVDAPAGTAPAFTTPAEGTTFATDCTRCIVTGDGGTAPAFSVAVTDPAPDDTLGDDVSSPPEP